jgi:hypothetical protein
MHPEAGGASGNGGTGGQGGDHGAPSSTYPAFTPDVPTIVSEGGPVLSNMRLVTVTWPGDENAAVFEAFGDAIGSSSYWRQINSEYGVGGVQSGAENHVRLTSAPPAAMTDGQIRSFLGTQIGASPSALPPPTSQTLYALYLSKQTTLMYGNIDACMAGVGGYHNETTANGVRFAYAVLPQCPIFGYGNVLMSASHELNEAATDPFPGTNPAYDSFDADHLAYSYFNQQQEEVGDACEFFPSSFYMETDPSFSYYIQRQWSNASARAGHNPCVPAVAQAYFNLTVFPEQLDTLAVAGQQTKGFKAMIGQPRTFQVGFFSDRATARPWSIQANVPTTIPIQNRGGMDVANGTADVVIDKTSGVNGEKAYVTVTPKTWNASGMIYLELVSTYGASHYLPLLIGKM